MRDEIQLTRMLIDYFGAKEDVQTQKRQRLVQWLKSLPKPQSMSMVSNMEDSHSMYSMYFREDLGQGRGIAFEKSYSELLEEIYPMMSHYTGVG
jgi:hypothetical protein